MGIGEIFFDKIYRITGIEEESARGETEAFPGKRAWRFRKTLRRLWNPVNLVNPVKIPFIPLRSILGLLSVGYLKLRNLWPDVQATGSGGAFLICDKKCGNGHSLPPPFYVMMRP
jgi:hypothetical protein